MRKDLLRRLEKLEAKLPEFEIVDVVWCSASPDTRRPLNSDERIVEDWYVKDDDIICEIRQRITADPSDGGRNYRRDAMGHESEAHDLQREITEDGTIIAVVRIDPPIEGDGGKSPPKEYN